MVMRFQSPLVYVTFVTEKVKVRKKAKSGTDIIKYHTWPNTSYGKVTKTQENITQKRAKPFSTSHVKTTWKLGGGYSKPCLKRPLKNRQLKGINDKV